MTLRRVVALAQALTMILLLAPGPFPVGPSPVLAAFESPEADPATVYDATGRGVGCVTSSTKYKGPGLPKDPPWPPGAEPTPTPEPTPFPTDDPAASADSTLDLEAEASTEPSASVTMGLVAATEVRLAQADLETEITPDQVSRANGKLLQGIDVSHHNGDIDYGLVKDAGHRFVFIKATQDNDFIDPMFPTNLARARAAGLAAGAYHFFDYTLDGTSQADHFLDRVLAAGGIENALPPVVDVECWAPIGTSIHAVSTARLRDFVERVYERTGRMPMVYTSVHMWREVVGNAEGFEDLPLWAACWDCDAPPSLAPGWEDWAFWQIGLARIPGVGRLDGNYFEGTRKQLNAMKTRPFSIASGAVATAGEQVRLDLGSRDATHIRTSDDGETWSKWSRHSGKPTTPVPAEEGEFTVYAQLRNGPGLKSPVFSDSIVVDRTPPQMSTPTVSLRQGPIGSSAASVPVSVAWEARDDVAGLSDAVTSVSCDEGRAMSNEAPGSAAPGELATWAAEAMLVPDAECEVTAIAHDGAGNESSDVSPGVRVTIAPSEGEGAGVSGDQFGLIARRGPDAGRAAVLLDGQPVGLVDLYAPETSGPEIVFIDDLAGRGTISVEATGNSDPASSGTVVSIDGYAVLSR